MLKRFWWQPALIFRMIPEAEEASKLIHQISDWIFVSLDAIFIFLLNLPAGGISGL
jgi:hypothetical protein